METGEFFAQAMPLLALHREELTTNKELMVLNPLRSAYEEIEARGGLLLLGAFDGAGALVGYSAGIIAPNLHYADVLMCQNDVLFVLPDHRGTSLGIRLIRETEAYAVALGCHLALWHAKPDTALNDIMPRMGCRVQDVMWSKVLG